MTTPDEWPPEDEDTSPDPFAHVSDRETVQ